MRYEHAMVELRAWGVFSRVRRAAWAPDVWITSAGSVPGDIYMQTATGQRRPWAAAPADLLADDWHRVDERRGVNQAGTP